MIVVDSAGTPHRVDRYDKTIQAAAREYGDGRYELLARADGVLFNPVDHPEIPRAKDPERGEAVFCLRACSRRAFDAYTQFLRSKNEVHRLIAQREFLDD